MKAAAKGRIRCQSHLGKSDMRRSYHVRNSPVCPLVCNLAWHRPGQLPLCLACRTAMAFSAVFTSGWAANASNPSLRVSALCHVIFSGKIFGFFFFSCSATFLSRPAIFFWKEILFRVSLCRIKNQAI